MSNLIAVTLFNANTLAADVVVNASTNAIYVDATNADLNWQPTATPNQVWLDTSGPASAGIFAIGVNHMSITPEGITTPRNTCVTISGSTVWSSVQLYLYFNSYNDVDWALLNGGAFVASSVGLK